MEERRIPRHVAIILDGNGRWAKKRMMPRTYGHVQGSKNVEAICQAANDMGISYLTVYAFSTENWKRPKSEVDTIMQLLNSYLKNCLETARKHNMQVRIIGDKTGLTQEMQDKIAVLEQESKSNTGLHFQVALNYGGRDEIVRTVKKLAQKVEAGVLAPQDINEAMISEYLDTGGIPDPDLMIRTSGEYRLSNYLIWQLAYAEFYFTDVLWPDFNAAELEKAVDYYNGRNRRFGGI